MQVDIFTRQLGFVNVELTDAGITIDTQTIEKPLPGHEPHTAVRAMLERYVFPYGLRSTIRLDGVPVTLGELELWSPAAARAGVLRG
jgi:hypothetical protein